MPGLVWKKILEGRSERQKQMFAPMREKGYQYFNSGVMLWNVSSMRNKYSFNVYLQAMKEWNYEMVWPDQDILNYVHWQNVDYMDPNKYNLFASVAYSSHMQYETVKDSAYIIHFTGSKPWNTRNYHYNIEKIWWDFAKLTPSACYNTLIDDFMRDIFEDCFVEKLILAAGEKIVDLEMKYQNMKDCFEQMEEINQKLIKMISQPES